MKFLLIILMVCSLHLAQAQNLDSVFQTARSQGFSGVVLYGKNDQITYHNAAGYRSFEATTKLQNNDVFELASISKQFTAMVIMKCKEEKLLSYDDLLEKYIDIPYKNITIRQLLHHTSGLPDYQAIMDKYWDKTKVAGNEEIIAYLNKYFVPVSFQAGEKYEYSNTGYVLLASVAEKVTGKPFSSLCEEWIFSPLGMKDTKIRSNEEKNSEIRFAFGHMTDAEGNYINAKNFHSADYTLWLGNRRGPGRISSTATDLFKWNSALYSDKIVTKKTLEEAFTSGTTNNGDKINYGFGWRVKNNLKGEKVVFHTGSNPGYATIIIRNLDTKEVFILLNNNDHPSSQTMINLFLK